MGPMRDVCSFTRANPRRASSRIPRCTALFRRARMSIMAAEGALSACTRPPGKLMKIPLRTLAMGLLLASGVAQAGLFNRKPKKAPAPPPVPVVVVPVAPPPPPPPIPLEFSGIQTAPPMEAPLDRLQSASADVLDTVQWVAASKDNAGLPFVVVDK